MNHVLHLCFGVNAGHPGSFCWVALLLTYALHSTLWAGALALLSQSSALSSATRNALWKAALIGPLLTSLLAILLPYGLEHWVGLVAAQASGSGAHEQVLDATTAVVAARRWQRLRLFLQYGAGLGLLRFCASAVTLTCQLHGREPVRDARLVERFERLRVRIGLRPIRLSDCAALRSPLVIGASEICVPERGLAELDDLALDSVFAHELAHLERGDGYWFPLVGLLQSVLWLQPINHWVAQRFRHSAELACDDRAVTLTRDPLGLARALTQLASAALAPRQSGLVPGMARSRGTLLARVRRLAQARPAEFEVGPRGRRWAFAGLCLLALVTPGVCVRSALSDMVAQVSAPSAVKAPGANAR